MVFLFLIMYHQMWFSTNKMQWPLNSDPMLIISSIYFCNDSEPLTMCFNDVMRAVYNVVDGNVYQI